ncbi:MAG: hypothetical protein KBA31_19590 [Alphaproteobacteria bacterium]|nr:hypothetical protein [Alphaproteobacteria bacterium]
MEGAMSRSFLLGWALAVFAVTLGGAWADDEVRPTNERRPDLVASVRADYAPCPVSKSASFRSMQSCQRCNGPNGCTPTERLVNESQQALARGDLVQATTKMEAAVLRKNSVAEAGFSAWAGLAELYCVQAARAKDKRASSALRERGLGLLREFRCGLSVDESSCAMPYGPIGRPGAASAQWGFVPNPNLTPMCFVSFCDTKFRNESSGPPKEDPSKESDGDLTEIINEESERSGRMLVASIERWCGQAK